MFSKEFMKFLYEYQKDEFKQEEKNLKIKLSNPKNGKLAKVYITNPIVK